MAEETTREHQQEELEVLQVVDESKDASAEPADFETANIDLDDPESMLAYQSLMRHRSERKRKRNRTIIIACAVLAALAITGIVRAVLGSQAASTPTIQTIPIYREDFQESISAQGTLKPIELVAITPEIEGTIESLNIAEGDTVEQGDVLFTIKNDALDKEVNEAALNVRSAENGVATAKNSLNAAYVAESQGDGGMVVEAQIALDSAYLTLESANEAYEQAKANAEKRTVVAPQSGSIVSLNAQVGASVSASSGEGSGALVQIANLSQMTVSVQVNELDISRIKVGQEAKVSFSALPDLELDATVTHIASVAGTGEYQEWGVVAYTVDLLIPKPDSRLKPGMTANVDIMLEYVPDALVVPNTAIADNGDGTGFVSVLIDERTGEIEGREVSIVTQGSTSSVVEGNLEEGELVVLSSFEFSEDEEIYY